MATLRALDVDNAMIEIDGAGSAGHGRQRRRLHRCDRPGRHRDAFEAPRRYIKVDEAGPGRARASPSPSSARMTAADRGRDRFRQSARRPPALRRRRRPPTASAATWRGRAPSASSPMSKKLWARGFALGASLDNAIVIGDDRVINPEGLRFEDEFVRHKALDAVGDLALAGAPILGCYRSYRGGHRLNVMARRGADRRPDAWSLVEAPARRDERACGTPGRRRRRRLRPRRFLIRPETGWIGRGNGSARMSFRHKFARLDCQPRLAWAAGFGLNRPDSRECWAKRPAGAVRAGR